MVRRDFFDEVMQIEQLSLVIHHFWFFEYRIDVLVEWLVDLLNNVAKLIYQIVRHWNIFADF